MCTYFTIASRTCQIVTCKRAAKYNALGVKNLDVCFCSKTLSAFRACFPQAEHLEFFLLEGEAAQLKNSLFADICTVLKKMHIPFLRVLHEHDADRTVAVFSPTLSRIAADGAYFAEIADRYAPCVRLTLYTEDCCIAGQVQRIAEELASLKEAETAAYAQADRLLASARVFKQDSAELLAPYVSKTKMLHYIFCFLKQRAGEGARSMQPGVVTRVGRCSALTAWGVYTTYAPFAAPGLRTVLIKDWFGGAAAALLNGLAAAFTECGYDVQMYRCGLDARLEHLVIPTLSYAFFTENTAHALPFRPASVLPVGRFIDLAGLHAVRAELRFNAATADGLLEEAAFSVYEGTQALHAQDRLWDRMIDPARLAAGSALLCAQFCKDRQNDDK